MSRRKKIFFLSLLVLWGVLFFWTMGHLVCEVLGTNAICRRLRSISGKITPESTKVFEDFYKNYIKKPICKAAKAIGLKEDFNEKIKRLALKSYKKVCPKDGVYLAPNIIYAKLKDDFVRKWRKNGDKVFEEFVEYLKKNYPEIMNIPESLEYLNTYGRHMGGELRDIYTDDSFFERQLRNDYGDKRMSSYEFRITLFIESPKYTDSRCTGIYCPQNQTEETVKKNKEISEKIKKDKFLKDFIDTVGTQKCGEGSIVKEEGTIWLQYYYPKEWRRHMSGDMREWLRIRTSGKDECINTDGAYSKKELATVVAGPKSC